jgi:hypothetical protein
MQNPNYRGYDESEDFSMVTGGDDDQIEEDRSKIGKTAPILRASEMLM